MKTFVEQFRDTIPIGEALENKNLKDFHWNEIKQILDLPQDHSISQGKSTLG